MGFQCVLLFWWWWMTPFRRYNHSTTSRSDGLASEAPALSQRPNCHSSSVGFVLYPIGWWKWCFAECSLVSFVRDTDLDLASWCQALLSASIEPANPFTFSEVSFPSNNQFWRDDDPTYTGSGPVWICILFGLVPANSMQRVDLTLVFLPNLKVYDPWRARRWVRSSPCMDLRPCLCTYW